jgi:hypothetical protein
MMAFGSNHLDVIPAQAGIPTWTAACAAMTDREIIGAAPRIGMERIGACAS